MEVGKMRREGREIIMIGHDGHPEVEGTMGQADMGMHLVETLDDVAKLQVANPDSVAYVSQTTLSVDDTRDIIEALKQKYPNIAEPKKGDICYATTNRQEAVKFMAPQVELVIVVGSPNSSNSNRCAKWPKDGHACLHGRQCLANRSGLAGRQAARGRDGRSLRAARCWCRPSSTV
jgi:4-hydroxy-3-methylbut-2-enyl diphosphate reductase